MTSAVDTTPVNSLFGRVSLGYLVIESRKLPEWQRFARDGLGLHADAIAGGLLALRIDAHQRRIIVREGSAEDVVAIGWQLRDEASLQLMLGRLRAERIEVSECTPAQAAERGVARCFAFDGPKRVRHELFTQPLLSTQPLAMQASASTRGCRTPSRTSSTA
jgi:hypothetical protein